MKKWKRILAVAVMLALVFCAGRGSAVLVKNWQNGGLLGVNAVASTTENWGLGFGESGTQPTGNATPEELRKYNTYFIGNGDDKVIYLTFDCGYENGNTEKILEALKKHDVKATFFVVGHFLETSPGSGKENGGRRSYRRKPYLSSSGYVRNCRCIVISKGS